MLLDRWRARRALLSRSPPSTTEDSGDAGLRAVVDALSVALDAPNSLGDPIWHHRWEGDLQVVGLDAAKRSVSDVRQRLARTVHELALRHMASRGRRLLAVVRCAPEGGEGLEGWHARLWEDQGEVGVADWKAARRNVAVLLLGPDDERQLFGSDRAITAAVKAWSGSSGG
jgi:hypothetical protein